jgi:prepilin-type N-terminal cleavage/methylation domain-containing protein
MKKILKDSKGFTLIELVVSILIFAIGFLGIMKMEQHAIMGNSFSMQMSNTLNIIDNKVEYLRGLDVGHAELAIGNHAGGIFTRQGIDYTLSWTVSATSLGASADAREVDVEVRWMEKETPHSITMNLTRSS